MVSAFDQVYGGAALVMFWLPSAGSLAKSITTPGGSEASGPVPVA